MCLLGLVEASHLRQSSTWLDEDSVGKGSDLPIPQEAYNN